MYSEVFIEYNKTIRKLKKNESRKYTPRDDRIFQDTLLLSLPKTTIKIIEKGRPEDRHGLEDTIISRTINS